jgi:serine/threonine protein kinase
VAGYEILGELGRGGMGIVYRAWQRSLGRAVALKMLRSDCGAGPEELTRFRREAEAAAVLRHANLVHIYDVGEYDRRPFFVLEFVDGGSLADRLDGKPLPPRRAAELVETLARAIHCAHQGGVIHRDLKPANVLLMADGTPKITDFGIAKKLDATADQTRSGAVMGTPGYMAPEQAMGKTTAIGPPTDVHALGTILYELLTGRPPFKGRSLLDTMNQVVHQAPVPPSRLQPNVPPDLERVCLRCLQKDPARRYATAEDLAAELRRHLAGPPPRAHRRSPWRWIGGSVALVILLGIGLGWYLWPDPAGKTDLPRKNEPRASDADGKEKPPAIAQPKPSDADGKQESPAGAQREPVPVKPVTIAWGGGKLNALALAPNGHSVAIGGEGKAVELRDTRTGELRAALADHPGPVTSLAWAPDGKTLAVGTYKQVWLWDVEKRKSQDPLKGHEAKVDWVGFVNGGKSLISIDGSTLKVWDLDTHKPGGGLDGLGGGLEVSRDGKYLAEVRTNVFDHACAVNLWEIAAAKKVRSLPLRFHFFALAPDGRSIAGGAGESVRVLEVPTGHERGRHGRHTARIHSVAIAADGRTLATGSHDRTAILWDLATREEVATLKGHTGPVLVRFSPDGKILATASTADPFVKLWDAGTGKERRDLPGHAPGVADLRFSPDGRRLGVVSVDAVVRIWDVSPVSGAAK